MKNPPNPRLMKIVQIQNNYHQHRKRLLSIQHLDMKKKPNITTLHPSEAINNYKQSKLKADIYSFKSTNDKIKQQNMILLSKIQRQYNKTSQRKNQSIRLSRSISNSTVRSSHSSRNLITQNKRIYAKLNNTKSIYSKFRQSQTIKHQKNHKRLSSKEELVNLLVNQLGVKPSVLFPNVTKRSTRKISQLKLKPSNHAALMFHENMLQQVRKKHNFTNINKSISKSKY